MSTIVIDYSKGAESATVKLGPVNLPNLEKQKNSLLKVLVELPEDEFRNDIEGIFSMLCDICDVHYFNSTAHDREDEVE